MFDETTDISTIEQMVIHARYVDENGKVVTKFLKILDCLDPQLDGYDGDVTISLNAMQIADTVTNFIDEKQLPYDKLVGLGTDGAPVMVGSKNRAVKKIVEIQEAKQKEQRGCDNAVKAVGQHCAAHKLNLAASKAGNEFPPIVRFKKTLSKLHEFYSRSAMRKKGLDAVQKLLSDSLETSGTGTVLDPSDTRWLALGKCTCKLRGILPSVLLSLERESKENGTVLASGLFYNITKLEFLAILALLCDVLPTVNRLSCRFQESSIDFSQMEPALQATVKALEAKRAIATVDKHNFKTLLRDLETGGIKIAACDDQEAMEAKLNEFDKGVKVPFIDRLIANLEDRFKDNKVMAAFSLLSNKAYYEPEKQTDLMESVMILTEQFGLQGRNDEARQEVSDIVYYLPTLKLGENSGSAVASPIDFLLSKTCQTMFPMISSLAFIYKTLPPHTVDCERDFFKDETHKNKLQKQNGRGHFRWTHEVVNKWTSTRKISI